MNSKFFQMGAKTWRDPVTHAKFIEEAKAKTAAEKNKKEEEAFRREVEVEKSKIVQEKIAETGRLLVESKKDEYLAQLKADVARLEAKQLDNIPSKLIPVYDKERAVKHAEEREKETSMEIKLTAQEMLKAQERELQEKKQQQDKELAEMAERKRRELLEYKHILGLSASPRQPPQRPVRFPGRPLALHDDPEFWKLNADEQHMLEVLSPDARQKYGFGPYEEDEIEYDPELRARFKDLGVGTSQYIEGSDDKKLLERMKRFICTSQTQLPGVLQRFPALALKLPLDVEAPAAYRDPEDRRIAQETIRDSQKQLKDELVKEAILQHGANALLGFKTKGPLPAEEEELHEQGYITELVGEGIPARIDQQVVERLKRKVRFGQPGGAQHGWGGHGGGRGRGFGDGMSLFGGGRIGNGGAGWDDFAAIDDGGGAWDDWSGGAVGGSLDNPFALDGDDPFVGGGRKGKKSAAQGWGAGGDAWGTGKEGGWGATGGWGGKGGWGETSGNGWADWEKGGAQGGGWNTGWNGGGGWNGAGGCSGGGAGGAFWKGGVGGWDRKKTDADSFNLPQGIKNLPFGAQMYVKRMREQQEREAREAAAMAGAGFAARTGGAAPPGAFPQAEAAPQPAGEDPALFGNAFSHAAFPFSPVPPPPHTRAVPSGDGVAPRPGLFAAAGPSQVGLGGAQSGQAGAAGAWAPQQPTTDPDHGAGAWADADGVTAIVSGAAPAAGGWTGTAQRVKPSADNGWKGAQPW
ncbi:hypothetical protein JCM10207_004010 [Rhodosporidiobolus poonsookiae]